MTAEFPDRDERALAEALDAALDREPQAQRRAGPRAPTDDLADLAASLRAAMPMPELPSGGRTEVRAAALAVRGAKRRDRARLLVAAAVTLVIGVVGGAALSSAVQQQGPTSNQAQVQVDLDYASGYLAKHDPAKAKQYIERASKAMLGKAPAPLAAEASTAGETAAIAVLRQELAVQMQRDTNLEAENARLSRDLGSMTRTAQADVPGPATGSTSSTTTPPRTAITAPTTTAPTSAPPSHDGTQVCAAHHDGAHHGGTHHGGTHHDGTHHDGTHHGGTHYDGTHHGGTHHDAPPDSASPDDDGPPPVPTVPVPTVPVPTTKPPARSRGIGPPVPLAEPTTTTTAGAPPTNHGADHVPRRLRPRRLQAEDHHHDLRRCPVEHHDLEHDHHNPVNYDNDRADNHDDRSCRDDHDERCHLDHDN